MRRGRGLRLTHAGTCRAWKLDEQIDVEKGCTDLKLGAIGGLLVLLTLAAAGCDAEPADKVAPTSPLTVDPTEVNVVYASRERQPPILFPGDYGPLWADLDTDAPIIDDLLSSIAAGTPVDPGAGASNREVVTIRTGWGMEEEDIEVFDGRT